MFRVVLGKAWNIIPQSRYLTACARAHSFLDYYIKECLGKGSENKPLQNFNSSSQSTKHSLIRDLCLQTDDSTFIRSQVIQAMMAAQDTTAELLTNALFLLARHPIYWDQLRTESLKRSQEYVQVESLLSPKVIENILLESKLSSPKTKAPFRESDITGSPSSLSRLPAHWSYRLEGQHVARRRWL